MNKQEKCFFCTKYQNEDNIFNINIKSGMWGDGKIVYSKQNICSTCLDDGMIDKWNEGFFKHETRNDAFSSVILE